MNQALYAHMNNKRKMKKKKDIPAQNLEGGWGRKTLFQTWCWLTSKL
jgi:hypothetical protein